MSKKIVQSIYIAKQGKVSVQLFLRHRLHFYLSSLKIPNAFSKTLLSQDPSLQIQAKHMSLK